MVATLAGRIGDVCKFDYVFYFVVKIHLMLLLLSTFPVIVGELEDDGRVVLLLSTVINLLLLAIAVGVLLFCRWYSNTDNGRG